MAPPSRFSRLNLTAIVLLGLSLLNIATAAPLPDSINNVTETLVARTEQTLITEKQYIEYLLKYFPETDQYLLYSGGSKDQVKAFQAKNPGYYYYDDFFSAPSDSRDHPWYDHFDADGLDKYMDDAEASSTAIIKAATKRLRVFGAAEYKTAGAKSFFATTEIKVIQERINNGEIEDLIHMAKDATSPTDILATEDGHEKFTWKNGHKEGTKNASGSYGICKRDNVGCDAPQVFPKMKSGSGKCTRGVGACDKQTDTTNAQSDSNKTKANSSASKTKAKSASSKCKSGKKC